MKLALLFTILSGGFLYFGLSAFELTLGLLLIVPVFAYLLGIIMPLSFGVYCFLILLLGTALVFLSSRRALTTREETLQREAPAVAVFIVIYTLAWILCMRWPDFISIGERLRDYAILASVVHSPVKVLEPWMSGSELNYYAYWYRFGHMLSRLLSAPVWEVYHSLVAFSIATYATVTFRLLTRWLNFSTMNALLGSVMVSLGSNAAGVYAFLNRDENWWGPSRVITGAINEFPAWSFLLGDLHPHYLNLSLIPFLILIFISLGTSPETRPMMKLSPERILLYLGLCILPFLWLKNANIWEIPMWGGLIVVLFTVLILATRGRFWLLWKRGFAYFRTDFGERSITILILLLLALFSLYLSAHNIVPGEGNDIRLVLDPIARSTTMEILKHWGFPLVALLVCNLILLRQTSTRLVAAALLFGSLFVKEGLVLLCVLLVFNCLRVAQLFGYEGKDGEDTPALPGIVMEAIGIAALGLLILPEFVFVDDPYGGENERMNTIFKVYTTSWFLLHVFAFYLLSQAGRKEVFSKLRGWPATAINTALVLILLGFFYRTVGLRSQKAYAIEPRIEGLSQIEIEFPGAAAIIRGLRALPGGVVLEAQGNAYSYTSFVSTLAGRTAYLGWANHVNLLNRAYEEVTRREKMTESIYREPVCQMRSEMVRKEGIAWVVLGSLEKQQHPGTEALDWSCFKQVLHDKEYVVYSPN